MGHNHLVDPNPKLPYTLLRAGGWEDSSLKICPGEQLSGGREKPESMVSSCTGITIRGVGLANAGEEPATVGLRVTKSRHKVRLRES